ncbi:MAG: glycosyltransferase family 4 protein [Phormidesmis sp. RL_2_1]|nr:glycosyltransferase family 4 protein [Phormidesmis sp. RL_2_1]
MEPLRLLLVSTPVGPLGSGLGGGVELTVINLTQRLVELGHSVVIAAPQGSVVPQGGTSSANRALAQVKIVQIPGACQLVAQIQGRAAAIVVGSALANAWDYARQVQAQYDLLVNFAYDWLPFYLTPFLTTPVAHFVSMGSLSNAMDQAIADLALRFPGTLGAYTRSQANTFTAIDPMQWEILGSAIDISQYQYRDTAGHTLAWVGRISPEKGLEDAIAAAMMAGQPLRIFGQQSDLSYWQLIKQKIKRAPNPQSIKYCGFLETHELQQQLGRCRALLVTPHWSEAFGIVAIEALACGVPVIAYRRGGLAEIVRHGETGWLVKPGPWVDADVGGEGNVTGLVSAIAQIDQIDRLACRQQAETTYSLAAWGNRFEEWFYRIASSKINSNQNHSA